MATKPGVTYEKKDLSVKAVFWFSVGLLMLLGISGAAVYVFMRVIPGDEAPVTRELMEKQYAADMRGPLTAKPEIRAQLEELNAMNEDILTTYSWVNQQENKVRIPIERAMELVAKEGLPHRRTPPSP